MKFKSFFPFFFGVGNFVFFEKLGYGHQKNIAVVELAWERTNYNLAKI